MRGGEALRDPRVHAYAARIRHEADGNTDENALDPQRFDERLRDLGAERVIDLGCGGGHVSFAMAPHAAAVVAYDPAFAYELAHIVESGLARMFGENPENIYFYITIYNEPYPQPAEPENVDVDGILRGMHLVSESHGDGPHVQLLASGVGVNWALKAQELLRDEYSVFIGIDSVGKHRRGKH